MTQKNPQNPLVLPFALLCAVAAALFGGVLAVDCRGRTGEDTLTRRHHELLDVKKALVQVEYELILARLDERRVTAHRDVQYLRSFEEHTTLARRSIELLFARQDEPEVAQPMLMVLANLDRYRDGVALIAGIQRELGAAGDRGHLVDLASGEQRLQDAFQSLGNAGLIGELVKLQLRARDVRSTLDIAAANRLLDQVGLLSARLRESLLEPAVAAPILADLERYRDVASRLLASAITLDLAINESTLQFDRILPHLRLAHSLVDDLLGRAASVLRREQVAAKLLVIALFSAGVVVLGLFIIWQALSDRRTGARLRALAVAMRDVAEGHVATLSEDRLPRGDDRAGELAEPLSTMAAQLHSQRDIIERERARAEAAESASRARLQRVTTTSHEMKTSLSGMIGLLDLLEQSGLTAEQQSYSAAVRANSESLLGVMSAVHEEATLDGGVVEIERREFVLRACLDASIGLFMPRAQERGLSLQPRVAADVPPILIGDDTRLRQIMSHLLGGAIKFPRAGELTIDVSVRSRSGSRIELQITVGDIGLDLTVERTEALFRPLRHADRNSGAYKTGGFSIGMSICGELVTLMGGRIWVERGDGGALRFCLAVPLEAAAGGQAVPESREVLTVDNALAERLPLRILLAEDTEVNQMLMTRLFAKMGYRLDVARNGREAVEMCRRSTYDLILMDIQMPEMDGWEAASFILQEADREHRPRIVAVTANASEDNRQRCLAVGMSDFVSKPFTLRSMQSVVERWGPPTR